MMNTLRQAVRVLINLRAYTWINIAGLVVSLTGVIIIARYLNQELNVDHYVPQLERTFVLFNGNFPADGVNYNHREGFPVVDDDETLEAWTRFTCVPDLLVSTDSLTLTVRGIMADTMFLDLLPRRVVAGEGALRDTHDALVTRHFAERMWRGESPIGKTLLVTDRGDPVHVAGVLDEASTKCNFDYDVLLHSDLARFWFTGTMVCRLKPDSDYHDYNARQKTFIEDYGGQHDSYTHHYQLKPLASIYFDRSISRPEGYPFLLLGNPQNVRILMLVAALLLAVGLFNFLNIYSVVMVHRRRNFAIRKAFGASRMDIFRLVFAENFLLTATALAAAWTVAVLASSLLDKYYGLTQLSSLAFDFWLTFAIAVAFPLTVSAVTTIGLWHGARVHSMDNADSARAIRLRRYVLLLPQMAIAIFLIAVSTYFMSQLRFMLSADPGFRNHDIATFRLRPDVVHSRIDYHNETEWKQAQQRIDERMAETEVAMAKLKTSPLFEHVAEHETDGRASFFVRHDAESSIKIARADEGREVFYDADYLNLTRQQFDLYEFGLIEGRLWDKVKRSDYKCLITASTKRLLGISDISRDRLQIDRRLWWSAYEDCTKNPSYEIIGVVRDFRHRHLAGADIPAIIICECENSMEYKPLVSFRHEQRAEATDFIRDLYAEINGGEKPDIDFIEDEVAELYADDKRTALIYATFALLAIVISMLGLFGVVLYDLRRRAREMRIRRVYGAKHRDIFRLIAQPYAIAITAAAVVATPAALLVMRHFQSGYSHHLPITPWYFLLAIATVFCVALLTIWNKTRI